MNPQTNSPNLSARRSTLPDYMRNFPRTDWEGVVFGDIVLDNDLLRRCAWAAREASRQWASDREGRSIDDAVFTLAVFDKVEEM